MNKLTFHNVLAWLHSKGVFNWMTDEQYLKMRYRLRFKEKLDLDNPKTFNAKLQWLKLYSHHPEHTTMVDKYEAKKYVADLIGEDKIIKCLGVWEKFDDIDFDKLPERFVLKCTHDSGGLVICKDKSKLDKAAARKKINKSLKVNYYMRGREWPYKNVKPRIIAEEYMEDCAGKGDLTDYKLHFFNGECKAIMVSCNRYSAGGLDNDYFTPEWKHFDFTRGTSHNAAVPPERPEQLDELIRLGKILAGDYPFVRIDFYVINGDIYFGEITFYPASGFNPFNPPEWDEIYGNWIRLPEEKAV